MYYKDLYTIVCLLRYICGMDLGHMVVYLSPCFDMFLPPSGQKLMTISLTSTVHQYQEPEHIFYVWEHKKNTTSST